MTPALALLLLVALGPASLDASPAAAPAAPSAARLTPAQQSERLPNGLTVVTVPFASPGLVAYYTLVRVGSRHEVEAGHTGFAHLFEHMMFRGTRRFPGAVYADTIQRLGFDSNAFTSDDVTVYTLFGPSEGLSTIVELEADRFQHLDFAEPEFRTEALAVHGEYRKNQTNPAQRLEEALVDAAFDRHTYGHTTIGLARDIRDMPRRYAYAKRFFARYYRPDNVTIFVVGDFDRASLLAEIRARYGTWSGVAETPRIAAEPPQTGERKVTVPWPSQTQPRTLVGYRTPPLSDDTLDGAIQTVLGPYLFGATSPLYASLVLERQLAESLTSTYYEHRDPHLFSFLIVGKDASTQPELEAAVEAELAALRDGRVDERRLADIRENLRNALALSLETSSAVAVQLAWFAGITGNPDSLERLYENVARVQPQDLAAFAKRHLVPEGRTTVRLSVVEPPEPPRARPARGRAR